MNTSGHYWVETLIENCTRRANAEQVARERYELAARYGDSAFTLLINAIEADVQYFRDKCIDGDQLLFHKLVTSQEFTVNTAPPFDSKVMISLDADRIKYEKRIRPNPRCAPEVQMGYMLVDCDYRRSVWLEHEGHRISFESASCFLIKGLLESLIR